MQHPRLPSTSADFFSQLHHILLIHNLAKKYQYRGEYQLHVSLSVCTSLEKRANNVFTSSLSSFKSSPPSSSGLISILDKSETDDCGASASPMFRGSKNPETSQKTRHSPWWAI